MLRISKLSDYGILLLGQIAKEDPSKLFTARDLAKSTGLPLPTVGKLLKLFSKGNFLSSHRGVNGGYKLARASNEIRVSDILTLIEGPVGLTDCSHDHSNCDLQTNCPVTGHWKKINSVVSQALDHLTLADMSPGKGAP